MLPRADASRISAPWPEHQERPARPADGVYGGTGPGSTPASIVDELYDLVHNRPAWHADAACREHPDVDFFPQRGESTRPAKDVCAGCLVRSECLESALREEHGVWGGSSAKERRRMRRQSALAPAGPRAQVASSPAAGAAAATPSSRDASQWPAGPARVADETSRPPRSRSRERKLSGVAAQIGRAHRAALEKKQAAAS